MLIAQRTTSIALSARMPRMFRGQGLADGSGGLELEMGRKRKFHGKIRLHVRGNADLRDFAGRTGGAALELNAVRRDRILLQWRLALPPGLRRSRGASSPL